MIYYSACRPSSKREFGLARKTFMAAFACFFLLAAAAQAAPFANQWEWDNPLLFGKPRLVEETSGNHISRTSYDREGIRQKTDVLSPRGEALATMVFNYDDQGNLVEIQFYQPRSPHPFRETAQYEDGKIVRMAGPHFPRAAVFEYDEEGRLNKIIVLDTQGLPTPSHWHYIWNDQNQLLATEFYALDGSITAKEEFEYNEQGFASARNAYGLEGNLLERREYEYRYDRTGNWTRKTTTRITHENDSEQRESATINRKISYY